MKTKRQVGDMLERAANLTYSLENAVRARKADEQYVIEMITKIKELVKKAEYYVNLEHES